MTLPDKDTLDTLGGEKANEAPIEDITREEDAEDRNRFVTDVAMLTRTAARCVADVMLEAATVDMVLIEHESMWGAESAVAPTMTRASTGVFRVTWPASVQDELGESHDVNLQRAQVSVRGTAPLLHTEEVTAPNQITVRIFDLAGAPDDAAGTVISVWGYY